MSVISQCMLISVLTTCRDGGGSNPGNNLHVSGLSHKVDTRDLEAAFAKVGRVSPSFDAGTTPRWLICGRRSRRPR